MALAPQINDGTLLIINWHIVVAHAHFDERGVAALSKSTTHDQADLRVLRETAPDNAGVGIMGLILPTR
jgi:hypothetical protein